MKKKKITVDKTMRNINAHTTRVYLECFTDKFLSYQAFAEKEYALT